MNKETNSELLDLETTPKTSKPKLEKIKYNKPNDVVRFNTGVEISDIECFNVFKEALIFFELSLEYISFKIALNGATSLFKLFLIGVVLVISTTVKFV